MAVATLINEELRSRHLWKIEEEKSIDAMNKLRASQPDV
jgi:hypothetical protein